MPTDDLKSEPAESAAKTAPGPGASVSHRYWLIGTIVLVACSCFSFPQVTLSDQSLDYSWQAILIFAHEKGLQFGRDIVFTYGPLGFLSIECFSPYSAAARLIFEVVFGFGIATGLCLLAWRMTRPWRLVFLGFFLLVTVPLHWNGDALYADIGLFSWGLLCFLESGRRLRIYLVALVLLAAVGALVKFTYLLTGLFTIGIVAGDLLLRRQRTVAAGTVAGFVLAFAAGWILSGQQLSGLGGFLASSFRVTNGYNQAMGLDATDLTWGFIATLAAFGAITIRVPGFDIGAGQTRKFRQGLLLVWLAGLLFEEWKYGCVRSDWDHVATMVGVIPLLAIGLEALPAIGKRLVFWSRAAGILCIAAVFVFLQKEVGGFVPGKCAQRAGLNLSSNLRVLARPVRYLREQTDAFNAEQMRLQLPQTRAMLGNATADIFGQGQVFGLFNELNYRPRPVFQSYAAYSRSLMELNEQFYLSKDCPEFVLFNLHALDNRFPPLEDAFALRELLANYEAVSSEADFLVLRRKGTAPVRLSLIKEGTAGAGERVDLPDQSDACLWLEIELQPGVIDRLQGLFCKSGTPQLNLWGESENAAPTGFRAPSPMLSAGFLVSPLVLDNNDLKNIYSGTDVRRARAFSVDSPSGQSRIHFRIYRFEKPKAVPDLR